MDSGLHGLPYYRDAIQSDEAGMTRFDRAWIEHPLYREMETQPPYSVRRRRFWRLFAVLAVLSLVAGILAASFFGTGI